MSPRGPIRRTAPLPQPPRPTPTPRAIYHGRVAIDEPLLPPAPLRRRLLAPVAAIVVVLALLVGGGAVAFIVSQSAGSDAPPEAGPFVTPQPARPAAVFDVREINGATLTLLSANTEGEPLTVALPPGVVLEALVPGLPSGIERGQWLTFTGEGDPVRNYVIRQVIVIREPGAPLADGLARSAAGFTGLELLSNPNHRPVLWGRVESVTPGATEGGADVTLSGPDGPITVQLFAGVSLFFLEPYDAPISGGDRIATRAPAGASPASAQAVLVTPQGAR